MSTPNPPLLLTILMPCLNEAETLGACVRQARVTLERLGLAGEVLVADNGSVDGSAAVAEREGARVVSVAGLGYGNALRQGIEAAFGRWIVIGDADGSYDFSRLDPFLEQLRNGADLVMGCRLPSGGGKIEVAAMPWKHRWIGNPALSFLGRLFFRSVVRDFHCGMRAFDRERILNLQLQTTGMEFASEMVIKASLAGLRIAEVPITLRPAGRSRPPHLRSWRDGWRHLRFMLLFSPRWLFLIPGATLVLTGSVFGLRLCMGPLTVGRAGFDTNTLLVCCMAVIIGLQICLFAVFTRIFAIQEGLLPAPARYAEIFRFLTLERGLAAGMLLILVGIAVLTRAFIAWSRAGFGNLSYPDSLRLVIPSVTFMTIGTQVIFSSFFLSILGLKRKTS